MLDELQNISLSTFHGFNFCCQILMQAYSRHKLVISRRACSEIFQTVTVNQKWILFSFFLICAKPPSSFTFFTFSLHPLLHKHFIFFFSSWQSWTFFFRLLLRNWYNRPKTWLKTCDDDLNLTHVHNRLGLRVRVNETLEFPGDGVLKVLDRSCMWMMMIWDSSLEKFCWTHD